MSGYTFDQIPRLKKALTQGNLQTALDLVPIIDVEDGEYEYIALLAEIQSIFLLYYETNNQLTLNTTIELIAKSENLFFIDDWPQFTDLISNVVGAIVKMNKGNDREHMLKSILSKLPLKDNYVVNHHGLSYNLACYYATKEDVKTMMEYVRRARFSFEAEKFLKDSCFEKYKDQTFFLEPLKNIAYTMFTWWTCLWPIEEWYEES